MAAASDTIETGHGAAQALLCDYAGVLDDGPLEQWPTFFTDPCLYRITTRDNERRGFPLSIMLCDSRAMLYDRVEATEKANIFEPHTYRHVLSESRVTTAADGLLRMRTSFMCARTMRDGDLILFATGVYVDEIVSVSGQYRFRSKTVILDQSRIDTLIAIPL
jgi:anthranilate 1,2-dioxygenase small subunit